MRDLTGYLGNLFNIQNKLADLLTAMSQNTSNQNSVQTRMLYMGYFA
jgi:hypothetical protein